MAKKGDRPVGRHIMAFLEQHEGIGYRIADLITEMSEQGWRHGDNAVGDNLKLLVKQGLIIERNNFWYGIPKNGEITIPESSKPKQKPGHQSVIESKQSPESTYIPKPKHDHCDTCGRKFERGDKFYVRNFSNVQLVLCEDCHAPKIMA
jgi:hypothetical protein